MLKDENTNERYPVFRGSDSSTADSFRGYKSGRNSYRDTAPSVAFSIGMHFSPEIGRRKLSHCQTMPWETPTFAANAVCETFGFAAKYSVSVMVSPKIAALFAFVNSSHCTLVARLIAMLNLGGMVRSKKKAGSELEPWQQEDARRLRKLFDARHPKVSQGDFGAQYGIGTQGAVWQYLHGHRPLNAGALGKFAHGLGVTPQDISPTLTREITQLAEASKGPRAEPRVELAAVDTVARPVKVMMTVEPDDRGIWEKPTTTDERDGYINTPSEDPRAYAIRILGDELQPRVRAGEYLLLEPGRRVVPGDEVVVRTAKAFMIREYLFSQDGNVVLCAINGGHGRHTVAERDITEMIYIAAIVKNTRFIPA